MMSEEAQVPALINCTHVQMEDGASNADPGRQKESRETGVWKSQKLQEDSFSKAGTGHGESAVRLYL